MSHIVFSDIYFSYLQMPKIKDSRVIFCKYCYQKTTKKDKICNHVFKVKMVDIRREIKTFFPLCPL